MSFFSEYVNLIQGISEDIEAGINTAKDHLKVVRKRITNSNDYRPISDYYYMNNRPKKYEEMRVCDVLQELVLRNMMR